jgi:hypothetical protein
MEFKYLTWEKELFVTVTILPLDKNVQKSHLGEEHIS